MASTNLPHSWYAPRRICKCRDITTRARFDPIAFVRCLLAADRLFHVCLDGTPRPQNRCYWTILTVALRTRKSDWRSGLPPFARLFKEHILCKYDPSPSLILRLNYEPYS